MASERVQWPTQLASGLPINPTLLTLGLSLSFSVPPASALKIWGCFTPFSLSPKSPKAVEIYWAALVPIYSVSTQHPSRLSMLATFMSEAFAVCDVLWRLKKRTQLSVLRTEPSLPLIVMPGVALGYLAPKASRIQNNLLLSPNPLDWNLAQRQYAKEALTNADLRLLVPIRHWKGIDQILLCSKRSDWLKSPLQMALGSLIMSLPNGVNEMQM